MIIQHNISAINSLRNTKLNNNGTAKNLEKLSSGFKINRSADDAAGLAISEKMRGQIRGLAQAQNNISDGISLTNTIDGSMQIDHDMLQRIRELLVQAANGTYSKSDTELLQGEIDQLMDEIDQLSYRAEFNEIKVLRGEIKDLPVWVRLDTVDNNNKMINGNYVVGNNTYTAARLDFSNLTAYNVQDLLDKGFNHTCCTCNDRFSIVFNNTGNNSKDPKTHIAGTHSTLNVDISDITTGEELVKRIIKAGGANFFGHYTSLAIDPENSNTLVVYDNRDGQTAPQNGDRGQLITAPHEDLGKVPKDPNIPIQAGANAGEKIIVPIKTVDTYALGLRKEHGPNQIKVTPVTDAHKSIDLVDNAVNILSGMRADVGAVRNRLEHALSNVGNIKENLQAAESSIRDLDMAKEMMNFTKNNILVQASQSMLAQSNQLPQGVLSLLS